MKSSIVVALGFCLAVCTGVRAGDSFESSELRKDVAGPRTRVAVLGSPHLSNLPDTFDPAWLEPLLDRLAAFAPQTIAIEALPGESCEQLRRHPGLYPGVADAYCLVPDEARKSTGLDVPAAIARVQETLAHWPAAPTPAQRRRLAGLLAAANDHPSAVVQWLQLPPAERRAGDGVDAALANLLDRFARFRNENYLVGAALAARLGLQRVYAMDDHSADSIRANAGPGLGEALARIWESSPPNPHARERKALEQGRDMLALYRFWNRPDVLRASADGDFGAALRDTSPERYGRQYVAWWETRNLRMAANIRSASGNRPGGRVLVIVGSAHKPDLDAYLGQMHDVDIVDVAALLGEPAAAAPPVPTPPAR